MNREEMRAKLEARRTQENVRGRITMGETCVYDGGVGWKIYNYIEPHLARWRIDVACGKELDDLGRLFDVERALPTNPELAEPDAAYRDRIFNYFHAHGGIR
jgi:hypothetical protein